MHRNYWINNSHMIFQCGRNVALRIAMCQEMFSNINAIKLTSYSRLKAELFHRSYATALAPLWQLAVRRALLEHKCSYLLSGIFRGLAPAPLVWEFFRRFISNKLVKFVGEFSWIYT